MNRRLIHDTAMSVTRDLVDELGWKSDEDVERAFMTLFPVVEHGLLRYEAQRARMHHRLAKPDTPEGDEAGSRDEKGNEQ